MTRLRILLADDNPALMPALVKFLERQHWANIVAQTNYADRAIELTKALAPDLVLIDMIMPEMDGLEATSQIKQLPLPVRVILLSLHDDAEYRSRAQQVGADGYVVKSQLQEELPALVYKLFAHKLSPEA